MHRLNIVDTETNSHGDAGQVVPMSLQLAKAIVTNTLQLQYENRVIVSDVLLTENTILDAFAQNVSARYDG